MFGRQRFRATRNVFWRVSVALAFAICVAIGLIIAGTRSAQASENEDGYNFNKLPDGLGDSHSFDVSGMDRGELSRAFAGQLTVVAQAVSLCNAEPRKPTACATRKEIVFIDPNVPDRAKLIHSIGKKATAIVIELVPGRDGLSQIAAALETERSVDALHIISHGGEGHINLVGSADVSLQTLPEHLEQLQTIHKAMAPGADVLLYGCDIAKGGDGKFFVELLARLTGTHVAASEHLTGSARRGGDWALAYHTGTIQTQVLAPDPGENYDDVLATVTTNADSGAGSLRNAIANAADGETITFDTVQMSGKTIILTTADPDTSFGRSALVVSKTLTIDGTGGVFVSGDGSNGSRNLRLFLVTGGGNLTLKNIGVNNGRVLGGNGGPAASNAGSGGGAAGLGGAILNNGGTLNLNTCTLGSNLAIGGNGGIFGGGAYGAGSGGGGLLATGGSAPNSNTGGTGGTPNGGVGGNFSSQPNGGTGGTGGGGGGGAATGNGGNGGFAGGGGGCGYLPYGGGSGGRGGFGGGGGGGGGRNHGTNPIGGLGGFGGGAGANGANFTAGGGGGGAGLGGAIFSYGGTLNIDSCTFTGNSTIAGSGSGTGASDGSIFGKNVFTTSANTITNTPTTEFYQPSDLTVAIHHNGNFAQGDANDTYTITVTNISSITSTNGPVTVTDTLPAGLTPISCSGSNWSGLSINGQTVTISRSDALAPGANYEPLTLTVSVDPNASVLVSNTVTVSGGGQVNTTNDSATDLTSIQTQAPDVTVALSHSGNFTQLDPGDTYTIHVSNVGLSTTSGTVTVVDTLPIGLTPVSCIGSGWDAAQINGQTVTVTRSDGLVSAASYPDLTLTVSVDLTAPPSVANSVSVSGGNEQNLTNDSASDPTTINPFIFPLVITPASLTGADVGTPINQTLTVGGGTTPYTILNISNFVDNGTGLLSSNIVPNVSTGKIAINGTPAATGTVTFTVNVTNSASATLHQDFTLTVNPDLNIAPGSLTAVVVGETINQTVTISNGATPYVINVNNFVGNSTGLTVSNLQVVGATVVVTGTPSGTGSATFTVDVTDAAGATLSQGYTLNVNKASTTTSVSSDAVPAVFGQAVHFTATIAAVLPGSGSPTGTVEFFVDGISIGSTSISAGSASVADSSLTLGTHAITAIYAGDTNFTGSDDSGTPFSQVVGQAATTTTVSSDVHPSVVGQTVVFTATIAAVSPGTGDPGATSASVNFYDTGNVFVASGTAVTDIHGITTATCSVNSLAVGDHNITAAFPGDSNFSASTSSPVYVQTVNKDATTTLLSVDFNPSVFGQSVTFTATIKPNSPGAGDPTGTVEFFDGAQSLGVFSAAIFGGFRTATLNTNSLALGSHSITAVYSGNGNFSTSTSAPIPQQVNQSSTTTTVSSDANPAVWGQTVTFTATVSVSAPGSGSPTGTVNFLDGVVTIQSNVPVSNGTATLQSSALSVGSHGIKAIYSGDANFKTSTSAIVTQVINPAATTTTVTSSASPSVFSQSVVITATVSVVPSGAGDPALPGATVDFFDNGVAIPSATGVPVTTANGMTTATFTTNSLAVGTHPITATYNGNVNFAVSTSSNFDQQVDQDATTTTLNCSPNPGVAASPITCDVQVTAQSPGSGVPTGNVEIFDGATDTGVGGPLVGGACSLQVTLALGSHSIVAKYQGDPNYLASNSTPTTEVVEEPTTTTLSADIHPSVFGQSVTFTATVVDALAPAQPASGSVTFMVNSVASGTQPLVNGSATFMTSTLPAGTNSVAAVFATNATFLTSTASVSQVVNPAATSTAVTSSLSSSPVGQSVTLTATVSATAPGNGVPTGAVTFKDGGVPMSGGSNLSLANGIATLNVALTTSGTHFITADYTPLDSSFNSSTSPAFQQTETDVAPAAAIAITTPATGPYLEGSDIIVTGTATDPATDESFTYSWTVLKNGNPYTTGTTHSAAGVYTSPFTFTPDDNATYLVSLTITDSNGGSGIATPVSITVTNVAPTNVTILLNPNSPINEGGNVSISGIFVDPGTADTHAVLIDWGDGGPTTTLNLAAGVLNYSSVSHTYNDLLTTASKTDTIKVTVIDKDSASVFNTTALQINNVAPTVAITGPPSTSPIGAAITLGTTVGDPGTLDTFTYAWTLSGPVSGSPVLTNPSLTFSPTTAGNYLLSVAVTDPAGATTTANVTITITPAGTSTTLTASLTPAVFGQNVTFTATVAVTSPGAGTPTGNITFLDGTKTLGTAALASGIAAISTSALTVGSHTITAVYGGNANFTASTSAGLNQVVVGKLTLNSPPAATPNPATVGQAVSFSVDASDSTNSALSFAWDFGDSSAGSGATPTHTYTAIGTYTASVTISDAAGVSILASVNVVVVPSEIGAGNLPPGTFVDSTGAGIPDEMSSAAATAGVATVTSSKRLSAVKLSIKLNFAKSGNDSITLSAMLDHSSAGKTIVIDVGGVVKAFTLDKGKAKVGGDSATIVSKTGKLSANFTRGSFATLLASSGLTNTTVSNKSLNVRVGVLYNDVLCYANQPQLYKATHGKNGATK